MRMKKGNIMGKKAELQHGIKRKKLQNFNLSWLMSVFFLWLLLWDSGLVGWLGWAAKILFLIHFAKCYMCKGKNIGKWWVNGWLFSSSVKSNGSSESSAIVELSSLDTRERLLWTVPIHVSNTSDLRHYYYSIDSIQSQNFRPDTSLALGLLARSHIHLCIHAIFRKLPLLILL